MQMKRQLIFLCGFLGAFLFALSSILGGLQIEGYSFISQYISESFATDVPNTGYLRVMYIISGLLLFIFGLVVPSVLPKSKSIRIGFWAFAVFYGLGTITVALFPCDFGCPTDIEGVSLAQVIHNASAFFTYIVAPLAMIGIGVSLKRVSSVALLSRVSLICGTIALIFVWVLFTDPTGPYIGLFQRIIETCILGWVAFTSLSIRNEKNQFV